MLTLVEIGLETGQNNFEMIMWAINSTTGDYRAMASTGGKSTFGQSFAIEKS